MNPIVGAAACHHPVFSNFTPLTLSDDTHLQRLRPRDEKHPNRPVNVIVDWLGLVVPEGTYCHVSYYRQRWAHALRAQLCDLHRWASSYQSDAPNTLYPLQLPLPIASEEYFEYIDILEAVVDYTRGAHGGRRSFAMLELGAGFGHWTLTAHAALRQLRPSALYDFVLVETDVYKQQILRQVLEYNRVDTKHANVIQAAVGDRDEKEGVVQNGNPGWYAVHTCDPAHAKSAAKPCASKGFLVEKAKRNRTAMDAMAHKVGQGMVVDVVSLETLLKPFTVVDMIDIDIQGSEWSLFGIQPDGSDDETPGVKRTMEVLGEKALRVHIGTHGAANMSGDTLPRVTPLEDALMRRFTRHGWTPTWAVGVTEGGCKDSVLRDFSEKRKSFRVTPWGPVCMADGAFGFVNARLRDIEQAAPRIHRRRAP